MSTSHRAVMLCNWEGNRNRCEGKRKGEGKSREGERKSRV